MSTSEACAACGCNIKQSASSRGKPATVGAKTYCGECAKLIINDPRKKDSNVKLAARTPAPVGAGVGGGGGSDDDDWFKPKREPEVNSKAPLKGPGGSNRIAAIGSARSPKGSGRMEAPKPTSAKASGLQAKSSGLSKATPAKDESKKKGSRVNLAAASGRTPMKSSKSLAPASKLTEKVIDPVKPAAAEEKAVALEVDKPKRNSSRRLSAATSTRSGASRQSVRSSGRSKGKEEDSSDRSSRSRAAGAGGGMSPGMMMGIGIGAVVLLLFGALAMTGGGSSKKKDSAKTVEKVIDYGDKTPSHVWGQRAEEKKARGDRLGAADDFGRAAEAAEREGSGRTAETYSMKAYDLRKFTVLNESKGR